MRLWGKGYRRRAASERPAALPRPRAPYARTFLALCGVSGGAVGLQLAAWQHRAALLFSPGSGTMSVCAALGAALAGIGLGALVAGRWTDRVRDHIRFLAAAHLLLGAYTFASPWAVGLPVDVFLNLWQPGRSDSTLFGWGLLLGFIGLLPGTALIGALIPASMRVLTVVWSRLGKTLGQVGAWWIGGAAAAALVWGFGLPGWLGIGTTTVLWITALVHLALGSVGALLARRAGVEAAEDALPVRATTPRQRRRDRLSTALRGVAVGGAASAGAAAAGFRLLLTPLLAAQLEDRPASLAAALVVAVAAAALGAALMGRLIDHRRDRTVWAAGALAVAGWAALWTAASLPDIARLVPALAFGVRSRPVGEVLTFLVAVMPLALCLGGAWSALCRMFVKSLRQVGTHTGVLAAAWCGGGALAAVGVAALVKSLETPKAQCQDLLPICALILSAVGAALILVDFGLGTLRRVGSLAVIALVSGGAAVLTSGRVEYGSAAAGGWPVIFYGETPAAVVSVASTTGGTMDRWLVMNGRRAAGTTLEWSAPAAALGHVPLALHPSPQHVLLLGLRAGEAAGQVAAHRAPYLDVLEPIEDLRRGSRLLRTVIPGLSPRGGSGETSFRPIDPRGFAAAPGRYFDVILINGLDPGQSLGAGGYSFEYLRACSYRLRPGGICALRLPIEDLDLGRLQLVLRAFRAAFPAAQLWWVPVQAREVMLVGGFDRPVLDLDRLAAVGAAEGGRAAAGASAVLRELGGDDPAVLTAWCMVAGEALDDLAGAGPMESDEAPRLTMSIARSRWLGEAGTAERVAVLTALAAARRASLDARLRAVLPGRQAPDQVRADLERFDRSCTEIVTGLVASLEGRTREAGDHYAAALALNPDDRSAYALLAPAVGRQVAKDLVLGLAASVEDTAPAHSRLARLYRRLQLLAAAEEQFDRAVSLAPNDLRLRAELTEVRRAISATRPERRCQEPFSEKGSGTFSERGS